MINLTIELFGDRQGNHVFTPESVARNMIDLLPDKVWNKNTTFLDPVCKSGIFLQLIYIKLMNVLADEINDPYERSKWILDKQLFGIALDNQTHLLSTRVVYGHLDLNHNIKKINNYISIVKDKDSTKIKKAVKETFGDMRFDVVIGNPPYQEDTGSGKNASGAVALFDSFIYKALEISDTVCMITPTKWISGNQSNMKILRDKLREDNHIKYMIDFMNAKDCFNDVSIAGGVCYFLYDKNYSGKCRYTTMIDSSYTSMRDLSSFDIIPRHGVGDTVITKIMNETTDFIDKYISKNKWGFGTDYSNDNGIEDVNTDITVITPKDEYYIPETELMDSDAIENYKVMFTRVITEHAVEPSKNGDYKILSSIRVLKPREVCNASYMVVSHIKEETWAVNIEAYLKTKFVRFLILQTLFGIGLTPDRFKFIPMQDFSHSWTDQQLYKKYNLTQEEIDYIEKTIKPMQ